MLQILLVVELWKEFRGQGLVHIATVHVRCNRMFGDRIMLCMGLVMFALPSKDGPPYLLRTRTDAYKCVGHTVEQLNFATFELQPLPWNDCAAYDIASVKRKGAKKRKRNINVAQEGRQNDKDELVQAGTPQNHMKVHLASDIVNCVIATVEHITESIPDMADSPCWKPFEFCVVGDFAIEGGTQVAMGSNENGLQEVHSWAPPWAAQDR